MPNPTGELTEHGQALEDGAKMRRIAREIDALAEPEDNRPNGHPISSAAMLLRIRADQIDPDHARQDD